jgi:hypothetical protein
MVDIFRQIQKVVGIFAIAYVFVLPVPSKAFFWFLPAAPEVMAVMTPYVESTYFAMTGAFLGKETMKQGGKYISKKALQSRILPKLMEQLASHTKIGKPLLRDIRHSKVVWNPNYYPKTGKQLLYYISLKHGGKTYYKIGITRYSLKNRYRREYHSADITPVLMLEMPQKSALAVETAIKIAFISYRANNRAILSLDGGYTEVYDHDILELNGFVMNLVKFLGD